MLLTRWTGARRAARGLTRDSSGVMMIEFAFALPFLLSIAMAGTEVANLAVTILRLNQLAMLAADNAARVRSSMDEQDVNEVMVGLRFAGSTIKFGENGRVIISQLESNGLADPKKGYWIRWQRCFGAKNVTSSYGKVNDGKADALLATGMGPASQKIKPVDNSGLIFAEVRYTYHPLVASVFMADKELSAIQSFTLRERVPGDLTNTANLPDKADATAKPAIKPEAAKRLCDADHLSAT